jgi:glucosamine--fructose-6-phosphate aminotransferase (isomerizing)
LVNQGRGEKVIERRSGSAAATLMFREAAEAPEAVARLLETQAGAIRSLAVRLRWSSPPTLLTCARGSSDNAATYGRYLIETQLGFATGSLGLSVASVYRAPLRLSGGVCLAISQSGASPDLLAAMAAAKAAGALTVALVNAPNSPLAEIADEVIELSAGREESVAATKSFIASLAALAWLTAVWRDDREALAAVESLPEALSQAWALDWSEAQPLLRDRRSMFTLGRGPGFGVAQEAALKLKETCAIHAEAFSAAEVLHGPVALLEPGFTTLVFAQSDAARAGTREVAHDLVARGGTVIAAGVEVEGAHVLPHRPAHPLIEPILFAQSLYKLAAEVSVLRGLDPDRPPHLNKVTRTV